jgi:uncharacterized protein (TIGR02284 family)
MRTQETIRALNHLTRVCRSAEQRCGVLGRATRSADLARLLRAASEEWSRHGDELQALVLLLGGRPVTRPAPGAWLLGARMVLNRALFADMETPVLAAWHRLQASAVRGYIDALESYWPERIRRTVRLQADRAEGRYGRIAGLRGRYALHSTGGRL